MRTAMHKPVLKWAGGKTKLVPRILEALPKGSRLVEPFCGSCAVSLNADYPAYLLADTNQHLIYFYEQMLGVEDFVDLTKDYYVESRNTRGAYEIIRDRFNKAPVNAVSQPRRFLYLNRHCFNGLWRVNKKGHFNVPFGKYKAPYYPEKEILHFKEHFQETSEWFYAPYPTTFSLLEPGDVVYADPPYLPLSDTADFTGYTAGGFGVDDQRSLALCAEEARDKGIPVIISNHDTPLAREIFGGASKIDSFPVRRSIAAKGASRGEVHEILAHYLP
jgi:DNA adenine methylase